VATCGSAGGQEAVPPSRLFSAPAPFTFDRSWEFAVPPHRLWAVLSDTSAFRQWWPWLRSFEPVTLEEGARTRCSIGPPLPYVLTIDVNVVQVVPQTLVAVVVSGDLAGPARLEIEATSAGSRARLVWEVEVCRPMLRLAAAVARPMLQWGHEWVVSNGVEQFRRDALEAASA
jgi:hypothetical protein